MYTRIIVKSDQGTSSCDVEISYINDSTILQYIVSTVIDSQHDRQIVLNTSDSDWKIVLRIMMAGIDKFNCECYSLILEKDWNETKKEICDKAILNAHLHRVLSGSEETIDPEDKGRCTLI